MTFYEVLEIDPRASVLEIERAFRRRARKVHPDVNSGDLRGAEARMKLLNEIRDTLTDPLRRAVYDAELLDEAAARAAPLPVDPSFEPVTAAPSDGRSSDGDASPPFSTWAKRAGLTLGVVTLCIVSFEAMHPRGGDTTPTATPATPTPIVPAVAPSPAPPAGPRARVDGARRPGRAVVRIGTRADDVLRKLGTPDRIEPGRQSGDAVFHYGHLRLEIKNGRVTRGDAAD
jgi:curved DNA-binding protein CbpA